MELELISDVLFSCESFFNELIVDLFSSLIFAQLSLEKHL